MAGRLFISSREYLRFARTSMRLFSWVFILGGLGVFAVTDTAVAADQYRLEGQVGLPHAGRVKKKMQVMSFEVSPATMSGASSNVGGMSGGPGQWSSKDTYEFVEMKPLVFLQLNENHRHCVMTEAPKGRFKIDGLQPGTYKLTFAIPDLGYMEKEIKVSPDSVDKDGKLKLEFDFEAEGTVIEPIDREKIPEKAAKAFEKGVKDFGKGNGKKAFKEFEEAVKEADHYAEAWEYMGMIQHSAGKLDDAEKYFRKSLEIDSNSSRSLADLGTILLVKGDPAGARALYEKAVLIMPGDPQPRAQLGMALYQLQELSLAMDQLVKAKTINPKHFSQPQILSAEIYRLWGEGENMAAELHDFIDNFPDDPKVPAIKQVLESSGQ